MNKLSIKSKLIGLVIGLLVIVIGSGIAVQYVVGRLLSESIERISLIEKNINLATQWKGLTDTNVQRVVAVAVSPDDSATNAFGQQIKETIAAIGDVQKRVETAATTDEEKQALAAVAERRKPVLALVAEINALKKDAKLEEARALISTRLAPLISAYIQSLDDFIKVQQHLREQIRDEGLQSISTARTLGSLVMAAIVLISVFLAWALVTSITKSLATAVAALDSISHGDLTQSITTDREDELGTLMRGLRTMSERLRELVAQIRQGTDSVGTAATEIAHGNQDLSHRTEQAAASLEEMSAAIGELSDTVSNSNGAAQRASAMANDVNTSARTGGEVVASVATSMQEITTRSKHIGDIVGIIDGIAFQTNILALNAAVEAARAGEQGRGFAVVAGEVRTLAQRSAQSAREIKSLIEASSQAVESGSGLVTQAADVMSKIVTGVEQMQQLMGDISVMSQHQHDGIQQVQTAITHLDQATQQNAALVEESAAAAHSMSDQSAMLATLVGKFVI